MDSRQRAFIIGAGSGLSAALARRLARENFSVALMARDVAKLRPLMEETGAIAVSGDVGDPKAVEAAFADVQSAFGRFDFVVFNAAYRTRGPIEELDPAEVLTAYLTGAFGGFLVAQAAARRMRAQGSGSLFFTGATASVKAGANSVPFSMEKFALRGLAQALARELAPQNIHVAHFVIDGGISSSWSQPGEGGPADKWLDPDAIADTYLAIHRQHRSAWTWEVELRPWVERF